MGGTPCCALWNNVKPYCILPEPVDYMPGLAGIHLLEETILSPRKDQPLERPPRGSKRDARLGAGP